ncbi:TRAP-type mannitol/chloroaromatic compound transport system permease small subunit [Murinocardiopsis flavida]|uniref:TRAP-type mannitol/chloroaromatic compound transport system permease small subunit n=1 Tax=Murinocardiopsis flavida TaxID=645275 RepID=A0A2P8CXI6_9ACTN|nr:TRAP transporter small permease [Murinocardiopsis flavida]PSK89659.1 TRAP-type mannitol/chloroaromatic compound transport system permease small subunit [Murinocardiopsis flavida]
MTENEAPSRAERAITGIENALATLAALALGAMLLVMVAEVVMRYILSAPLGWTVGFVQDYLMVAVFFLGLSYSYRTGAHVTIDFVYRRQGPRGRLAMALIGDVLSFALFALVFAAGVATTAHAWTLGEIPAPGGGALSWPVWTSHVFVPLGCGVLLLRLAATIAAHRSGPARADLEAGT